MCLEDRKIGFQVLVATTAVRTALETGVNANDLHFSRTRCQFGSVAMPQKPIIVWCVCILPTAFALRMPPMARQMNPVSSARPSNSFGIDLCHELTFLIAGSDQETGNEMNLLHRVKSDLPTCQQLIVLAPVNQGVVPKRCRPMPEQWS